MSFTFPVVSGRCSVPSDFTIQMVEYRLSVITSLDRRSHVVSISPAGERVLVDAARLEKGLLGSDRDTDEQFRRKLIDLISTLGGARWRMEVEDGAETPAGPTEGADSPTESEHSATSR